MTVAEIVAAFGDHAASKLSAIGAVGQPEDQLRNPVETLIRAMGEHNGAAAGSIGVIGEVSLSDIKARPDFAVTLSDLLIGFVEVKAPGKGADPRKYKGQHDKGQAKRLLLRPNIIFTDGQAWSLWQNGELIGNVEAIRGDIADPSGEHAPSAGFENLFANFLSWNPQPPKNARELATSSARLCRLLRDEVSDELALGGNVLKQTAKDWRHLLFPEATDEQFADGYAQAVTFGLLIARAKNVDLNLGIEHVATNLGPTNSLIGRALAILGSAADASAGLSRAIETSRRVLAVVDWSVFKGEQGDAWLYFYEHFLAEYDPELRKKTGSYYTPPPVVESMTRWTDEALRTTIGLPRGLAEPSVTLIDPAMGTGTYVLEVLRLIARRAQEDYGPGAFGEALTESLTKTIGFEIQLGPYAVAQLRLLAELAKFGSTAGPSDLRTYVANTLSNPYIDDESLGQYYEPISASKREANRIKREEHVLVVLGNPPYMEKAKGQGSWVEAGSAATGPALLNDYQPPKAWGLGAHARHLRNLYVYFWRWATWKVFEQQPNNAPGIVSFITVAGFLKGEGFQQMRARLRGQATDIWVIHCSPEGHQPPVNSRIFQAVQHEVCIVIAVRRGDADNSKSAVTRFRFLAEGTRSEKFAEMAGITLNGGGWLFADDEARAPFQPLGAPEWLKHPLLSEVFTYDGSGIMSGRTWIYAPDKQTLQARWDALKNEPSIAKKRKLMSEHADRRVDRKPGLGLPGISPRTQAILDDTSPMLEPIPVAVRSFDSQWMIPDNRLLNRPNPTLWVSRSDHQIFMTAIEDASPTTGPAVTFTADIPDVHHFHGRGGRVFPLYSDASAAQSNVAPEALSQLSAVYGRTVTGIEVMAYLSASLAHPGYVEMFSAHLKNPGLRVPFTADVDLFDDGVALGKRVLWLHTFGQRLHEGQLASSTGAPRMDPAVAPSVLKAISSAMGALPDELSYNETTSELRIGTGVISNVSLAMRNYEVSGVNVLERWFSARRANRTKPIIGGRRVSDLNLIQTDRWLPEYTKGLIDLLNVLGLLTALEGDQRAFLDSVMSAEFIKWTRPTVAARVSTTAVQEAAAAEHGQVVLGGLDV
ncbi:N-6 DNA methylase [Cryobacterium sp. RTS3]|uniref:type ISP restriction/modification enzyme n=1 Tax=Cryobacterium sp. RTS3 TaxID=3048643 RepID=UPI002B23601A|nr:type ISP restriction/modification enzyme [Cryobacterium sp. RTS3]MEB0000846.1 N-6 DNA methylase [Cryobacterium sp. RTS3]